MENKLKQQLRERMLGQLSSEKTEVDVNNAYEVAVEFALDFVLFLRQNYLTQDPWDGIRVDDDVWLDFETNCEYNAKELLNKYLAI